MTLIGRAVDAALARSPRYAALEAAVSDTSDAIAELNTETDNLAARIDTIVEATDDATAAQLRPIAARLRGLAADASNPVPVEPVDPNA